MYNSDDLKILDEMIQDNAKIPLTDNYGKKQVILKETQSNYAVTILNIPSNSIVIEADIFSAPKSIFKDSKGECKRCDFVIVSNQDNKKYIIFIEMKAGKAIELEVIKQLKGGECLIGYCREIGKIFWNVPDFLSGYQYRFVSLKHINISKRPTREKRLSNIHDSPENMLKIYSATKVQFTKLIGQID